MIIGISGKSVSINNIEGPVGVNGRKSHNKLAKQKTGWSPRYSLKEGITLTYQWICKEKQNQPLAE